MGINISELENIINSLIYDRTQVDVDYAITCERNNIYIDEDLRGAYNVSDKNRVGGAIDFIVDCLAYIGVAEALDSVVRDDWDMYGIVRPGDNREILAALAGLKRLLPYNGTPNVPRSMDALTFRTANTVERIIWEIYGVFTRLWGSWLFCGDGCASEFDTEDKQIFDDNWTFEQTLT